MFLHILLPTDGSELSEVAVKQGIRLAKSLNAKITGLSVMPLHHPFWNESEIPAQALEEIARQHKAHRHLSFIHKAALDAGASCETLSESSDHPYEAIIQVAEKRSCDLILMASHGQGGVKGLLLGGETQKVLTRSKIPVLVFR